MSKAVNIINNVSYIYVDYCLQVTSVTRRQSLHSLSITELIAYSITSIALALYIDNQICDRRPVDLYILEFILISNS